ncbi:hypothetical protein C8R47DRAFT_1077360 [Mycena vitilis]|nr:hypothetical protein C8R47DRAFT_1077360 [Mycena vitilis]
MCRRSTDVPFFPIRRVSLVPVLRLTPVSAAPDMRIRGVDKSSTPPTTSSAASLPLFRTREAPTAMCVCGIRTQRRRRKDGETGRTGERGDWMIRRRPAATEDDGDEEGAKSKAKKGAGMPHKSVASYESASRQSKNKDIRWTAPRLSCRKTRKRDEKKHWLGYRRALTQIPVAARRAPRAHPETTLTPSKEASKYKIHPLSVCNGTHNMWIPLPQRPAPMLRGLKERIPVSVRGEEKGRRRTREERGKTGRERQDGEKWPWGQGKNNEGVLTHIDILLARSSTLGVSHKRYARAATPASRSREWEAAGPKWRT